MASAARNRHRRSLDIWPGFVDALATLLIIIIFTLMIFVVAQFYLTDALSGRDRALERLQREITRLGELLSLEKTEGDSLRQSLAEISAELQATLSSRDELRQQVRGLETEVGGLRLTIGALETQSRDFQDEITRLLAAAGVLEKEADALKADRDRLLAESDTLRGERDKLAGDAKSLEADRDRLAREAAALLAARDKLARDVEALITERDKFMASAEALRIERDAATGDAKKLETERDKLAAEVVALQRLRDQLTREAQALRAERDRLGKTVAETSAESARKGGEIEKARVALELLNRQVAALREQLSSLQEALDAQEAQNKGQRVEIEELTKRLNVALATKVKKLEKYRSEFFGRLRDLLGARADIQIVGDRFVFQSEVLFETASATLNEQGHQEIATLARTLRDISAEIPRDIDWILRVDGHTDKRPIRNAEFRSNWELSTARAVSVVKYLISQGIPPRRLAATGFGEFQPIDEAEIEAAFRRNRRIELKFDQR